MKIFSTTYIAIVVFLMTSQLSKAQSTSSEEKPTELIKQLGIENAIFQNVVSAPQTNTLFPGANTIFIEQVGLDNSSQITTRIGSSTIDLVQYGNRNTIRMNVTALSADTQILQQGNNNYLAEYTNSPSLNIERTINQIGNGQNLIIHGSNSLSEKMSLTMEGAAKTIEIRNFN